MASNMQVVPAPKKVEAQVVEMMVPLYSYGCEKKVKKALSHLRGIHSVHVEYELQKVTVWGICDRDVVLATIKKKRRESRFWNQLEAAGIEKEDCQKAGSAERVEEEGEAASHVESSAPRSGGKGRKMWKKLFPLLLH